ncbi:hypothetical protein TNCV_2262711 [Trichonephila clavipes]|nr:hypothetical protein TNCV_2262711 [Trichonephila clavipes]
MANRNEKIAKKGEPDGYSIGLQTERPGFNARCLRVHTEYVLVKSVGPKALWAEPRVQGTGEYFPPLQSQGEVAEEEKGGVVPSGNFSELIRTVTCMVHKA